MINQKESKQVRMDSWLVKLLSREMKKKQETKINQQTIIKNSRKTKNNRKVKTTGNITPTMDHYRRDGQMGDTDP